MGSLRGLLGGLRVASWGPLNRSKGAQGRPKKATDGPIHNESVARLHQTHNLIAFMTPDRRTCNFLEHTNMDFLKEVQYTVGYQLSCFKLRLPMVKAPFEPIVGPCSFQFRAKLGSCRGLGALLTDFRTLLLLRTTWRSEL